MRKRPLWVEIVLINLKAQKESKWRKEAQRAALTIWTALDPATKENGCLQVIPSSHTGEVIDHILYDDGLHPELPRELVQDVKVDHIELEPGDAIVWHAHLWHYSPPNESDQNRLGIAQVTISEADVSFEANVQSGMAF